MGWAETGKVWVIAVMEAEPIWMCDQQSYFTLVSSTFWIAHIHTPCHLPHQAQGVLNNILGNILGISFSLEEPNYARN